MRHGNTLLQSLCHITAGLIVQLFAFLAIGVFGANVGSKLVVALQLEVPHHSLKGIARGRAGGLEDPGACGATETLKTAFFDPYELAYRRHYSRKTKSRVLMFCTIFFILFSLNMQHHSMHLSGPPHESPQLAVSIRHPADLALRECGFHRVPLGGKQAQTADDQPQPENSDRSSSNFQSRVACWEYLCGDFPPPPENGLPCQEDPSVFRGPAQSRPVHIAAANALSLGLSCGTSFAEKG